MSVCAGCETDNPDRFRFCGECGAPLAAAPGGDASPGGEGERRQLTILFCDLAASTEIAHQLDPEEWRDVMRAYRETCAEVVTACGGHVAQYAGDAVKAHFGYPHAHADDAARAVRAALCLVSAMSRLHERLPMIAERLHVRVGIHTGLVVTGDLAGEKHDRNAAVGNTPNIAARLQTLAEPDEVLVSNVTRRLVEGRFELEDRGAHTLKGIGAPVGVFRVVGESAAAVGLAQAGPAGLTPLTGRERELGVLVDRFEQARKGRGQVVLISGESGIGKSRLLHAFRAAVSPPREAAGSREAVEPREAVEVDPRWLVCRCHSHTQSSALFPIIQLIQQEIGFENGDSPEVRLEKLRRSLAADAQAGPEATAIFASLLSLPMPKSSAIAGQSAEMQKRLTTDALLGWLKALASRQPLVIVVEDLHWADPSSLDILRLVLNHIDTLPILTLLARRPENSFPLAVRANVREIRLTRLTPGDIGRIVDALTSGRGLPREVVDQIVAKTDGVPLFIEELVKMVLESGLLVEKNGAFSLSGSLPPLAIPSTLQDSLMERLDRLGTAKEVAQLAAVIGREFSDQMLQAISGKDDATLQQALDRLVVAGLIHSQSATTHVFKHALVQEAAYHSLLKSRRQLIHRQVADTLANRFCDIVSTQPELLAHHYTAAGLAEPAVQYWLQAGQRAAKRSAFREAVVHLRRGLEVLAAMPASDEQMHAQRMRYELQLQVSLGDALIAVIGYGAPQVGEAYGRARDICQQFGEEPQLGFVLGGVWVYYLIRAEYQTALELAEQLMRLAEKLPMPLLIAGAHTALGSTLLNLGDIQSARVHLEKAVEHGERDQLVLASDLRVSGLCFLANALLALGETDQAMRRADEALARARDLGKPFFLANALTQSAWVRQLARDVDGAGQAADEAVALCTEQGFPYWQTFCLMTQGWVFVERGSIDEGLGRMMRSQTAAQESGTERFASGRLATLAEGYLHAGRLDDALDALDRAFSHVEHTGERFCEAELHRLRGEVLARRSGNGSFDEAAECFRTALALSRRQGARLWESRAAASLERLRPAHAAEAEL